MAVFKCKMCGGDLEINGSETVVKCEYCGSVQTVPQQDDEKKLIQFERAERLRKQCEFDKAAGIYESIVADFRQESEAYWGLVLCKYGIEYVDDPAKCGPRTFAFGRRLLRHAGGGRHRFGGLARCAR